MYTWPNMRREVYKLVKQIVSNLVFTTYYFIWILQLYYKAGKTIIRILQIKKSRLRRVNNLLIMIQEINDKTRTVQ